MTKDQLCIELNYVNASREKRSIMAKKVEEQPHLIPILIDIIKDDVDPISCKASWVLEYVTKNDLLAILNHINLFLKTIPKLKLESSIRPAAKICELLVQDYYSKNIYHAKKFLTNKHLSAISEVSFDWLIENHKVATKAYSMTTLFLIGRNIDWIHSELHQILKQNYESGSAAYNARARMTLKSLENIGVK